MSTPAASRRRSRRFDSAEQEAYLNLWRTYDRLKEIEDRLFEQHGLTAQQYNALRVLRAAHPRPMPTLALGERLVSRSPDMTRLVDKLSDAGWVERERRSDNRRVVEVSITAAGMELLDQLRTAVRDAHRKQLGHLTAAQREQLISLLQLARAPHEDPDAPWPRDH